MGDNSGSADEKQIIWNNDFEIVEHNSEDSTPQETETQKYEPTGFPKAEHRSLHTHRLSRSNDPDIDVVKDIDKMTPEEIKSAQKFLHERLGEEMCNFIIQRKLNRMNAENERKEPKNSPSRGEDGSNPELERGLTLKFSEDEEDKYIWMEPIESKGYAKGTGELMLHELRFNFSGQLLKPDDPNVENANYDPSLYNHGLDPDKPGYTIPELVILLHSSFKPQVQIAIRTLCNILHNAYCPKTASGFDLDSNCKYYFGYSYDRWTSYIMNDVDLVAKIGYILYSSQTAVNVLVDLLRCLSLLLFGECGTSNISISLQNRERDCFITPIQDTIFDLYNSLSGLGIYHWNPSSVELSHAYACKDFYHEASNKIDNNERIMKLQIFFSKSLDGHFEAFHVQDIQKEIFKIFRHDCKNSQNDDFLAVDSRVFLLTKCNIVKKLILIMERHKEEPPIQLYSTNIICGLITYFGTHFANVLVTKKYFSSHYKSLIDDFIACPYINWKDKFKNYEKELVTSLLFLIKYISIYSKNSFNTFCDDCGSVTFINQAMTHTLTNHLTAVKLIESAECDDSSKWLAYNLPASIGMNCFTVWFMNGEYVKPFIELVPVMEWTLLHVQCYLQNNLEKLQGYVNLYGHLPAAINLYVASYMESTGTSDYFDFAGIVVRGVGSIKELMDHPYIAFGWDLLLLIFSIIKLQAAYARNHVKYQVPDPYKEDKQITARLFGKDNVDNHLNLTIRLCDRFLNNIVNGFPSELNEICWKSYNKTLGSQRAIHNFKKSTDLFSSFVLPINITTATIEFLKHPRLAKHVSRLKKIKIYSHVFNRITEILKDFYLSLNVKGLIGIEKPTPTVEPWLKYLYELTSAGVENNIDGLLSVLAFACDYHLIAKVFDLYADKINISQDSVSKMMANYKRFNENLALYMGVTNFESPLVPFLGYITYFPLEFRNSESSNLNDSCSFILSDQIKNKLLGWICPYHTFVQIAHTASLVPLENGLHINSGHLFYAALEFFVFDRLSSGRDKKEGQTNETNYTTCKDWWISKLEAHLTKPLNECVVSTQETRPTHCDEEVLCKYFNNNEEMVRVAQNLAKRFNSGMGDSALVMGLLMTLTSKLSTEDCAKHLWADDTLMVLLGRNLIIDLKTMEVSCNSTDVLKLGHISTFLPTFNSSPDILKSQEKLLARFTEETLTNYDPVMFITLSSLLSHRSKEDLQRIINSYENHTVGEIIKHFL